MCRCDLLSLVPDPEDQDDTPGNSRAAVQLVDPPHTSRVQAGSGGRPSNQVSERAAVASNIQRCGIGIASRAARHACYPADRARWDVDGRLGNDNRR